MDKSNWAIVDNIPRLRNARDFQVYATALETCAKDSKRNSSSTNPLVYIPYDQVKVDKHSSEIQIHGCAIIAFAHKEECLKFVYYWRSHKSMREFANVFEVYSYEDFQKLINLPADYKQFKLKKDEYFNQRNLLWWLFDKPGVDRYRDQFVLRFRGQVQETQIFWFDELVPTKKVHVYAGEREKAMRKSITTAYVKWSNLGYYLVTMHEKGIKILGGPDWIELAKLEHSYVSHVDFSPCDQFLVTCSAIPRGNTQVGKNKKDREEQAKREKRRDNLTKIIVWDCLTGEARRQFDFETIGPTIKTRHKGWWPILHWSHDGKYFAKINSSKKMAAKPKDYDKINIYDSETMMQLDKRAHNAPSLFHMEFSPKDHLLAYSTFQSENDPASVSIIKLPDKNHARPSQVLGFDIQTAHLYWQSEGRFLAIKMGHVVSKKNTRVQKHSIAIIAVKKSNMPYTKSMDELGKIDYFAWEPNSSRFAIIHGTQRHGANPNVSFYDVSSNGSLKKLFTLTNRRTNTLKWAPMGGRCLVAHLEDARTGVLEFVDVNSYHKHKETKIVEHGNCKEVHWDPSGRYLISAATQSLDSKSSGDDTGYKVWTFQGEEIHSENIRFFYQIFWRPRPPSLLTPKEVARVRNKEMMEYIAQLDECDTRVKRLHTSKIIQENLSKLEGWKKMILENEDINEFKDEIEDGQSKLLSHYEFDYEKEYEVNNIEEEINVEYKSYVISKEVLNKINNDEYVDFDNLDENGNEMKTKKGAWA